MPNQESQYMPWEDPCAESLLQVSQNTLYGDTCAQVAGVCHEETPVAKHSSGHPNACCRETPVPGCPSPFTAHVSKATAPHGRAPWGTPLPSQNPLTRSCTSPCVCSQCSASSDRCPAGAWGLLAKPPLTKHILTQLSLAGSRRLLHADGSSLC